MAETPNDVVLSLRDVKKTFGPITAIKRMELDVRRGRVHTLLGENGAGKSTLMKILAGVQPATEGTILLDGAPFAPRSPQEAAARGLAIVFQELSLVNTLTVAENILATREPSRFGFISERKLVERAETLVRELGLPIDVRARVGDLSIAQRQLVEIAKGLSHDADIMILDEPTSSLSDAEAEILFRIVGRLTEAGKAVIYISHRMEEIMRLSDDITVMRDGEYVATLEKDKTSIDELIALMVGRQINEIYPPRVGDAPGQDVAPILEVEHISSGRVFQDVSFSVKPGEILGFFGLVGSGRSDVMKALFGMRWYEGTIRLDGNEVALKDPSDAIRQGIGFVTENRKEEGLVLAHAVRANITMAALGSVSSGGFLNRQREGQCAHEESTRLGVRAASIETTAGTLSGGNQQKVVLAKWLMTRPRVLILDEPTRGVDVGAKFEIYRIIRELAADGTAIIMVSSDLPEVLGLSDRVVIMSRKRVQAIMPRADLTPESVMSFATGQKK